MVDVARQLAAVTRTLDDADVDGHAAHVQTLTQEYPSPISDVWPAVTRADRIERWFLPLHGDLVVGGTYQFVGQAGGTIQECTPPSEGHAGFRVTWEYGGGVTWLEVELEELGPERTRLTLTHIARTADIPPGFWEQFGPGATGVGWDQSLLGLSLFLASDTSITPDVAESWMLSEEGMRFTRGAADAWARAHVAAGADAAAATAAADGTFAFYTGGTQPDM